MGGEDPAREGQSPFIVSLSPGLAQLTNVSGRGQWRVAALQGKARPGKGCGDQSGVEALPEESS